MIGKSIRRLLNERSPEPDTRLDNACPECDARPGQECERICPNHPNAPKVYTPRDPHRSATGLEAWDEVRRLRAALAEMSARLRAVEAERVEASNAAMGAARIVLAMQTDRDAAIERARLAEEGAAVLRAERDAGHRERLDLAIWIIRHHEAPGDWACLRCRPDSHVPIAGFVCSWHRSLDALIAEMGLSPSTPPAEVERRWAERER